MTTQTVRSRDRFLDALDAGYVATISALEATEVRGHRVSKALLAEARKGEKELLALTRRWVDEPVRLYENLEAMIDLQARGQRRALELARESLHGAVEYRTALRHALRQVIKANRVAGEALGEVAKEARTRAAHEAERFPRPRRLRPRAARQPRAAAAPTPAPVAEKLAG